MSRRYTAKDMRETADDFENYSDMDESVIADMLRQAADMMEREEKHEKKYEYTLRNGAGLIVWCLENKIDRLKSVKEEDEIIVRRSVGEWEEVTSEE